MQIRLICVDDVVVSDSMDPLGLRMSTAPWYQALELKSQNYLAYLWKVEINCDLQDAPEDTRSRSESWLNEDASFFVQSCLYSYRDKREWIEVLVNISSSDCQPCFALQAPLAGIVMQKPWRGWGIQYSEICRKGRSAKIILAGKNDCWNMWGQLALLIVNTMRAETVVIRIKTQEPKDQWISTMILADISFNFYNHLVAVQHKSRITPGAHTEPLKDVY